MCLSRANNLYQDGNVFRRTVGIVGGKMEDLRCFVFHCLFQISLIIFRWKIVLKYRRNLWNFAFLFFFCLHWLKAESSNRFFSKFNIFKNVLLREIHKNYQFIYAKSSPQNFISRLNMIAFNQDLTDVTTCRQAFVIFNLHENPSQFILRGRFK